MKILPLKIYNGMIIIAFFFFMASQMEKEKLRNKDTTSIKNQYIVINLFCLFSFIAIMYFKNIEY